MNLINTLTRDYPRSLWQLRQENPNVSFPSDPTDEDLAPYDHANVHPTPQPLDWDQRTQRLEEDPPALVEGRYEQAWVILDATAEQVADYDRVHAPAPDWSGFAIAVIMAPTIQVWFNHLPQSIASGLTVSLSEAAKSNSDLFLRLWAQLAPTVPLDVVQRLASLAEQNHLPSEFVSTLSTRPDPA